MQDEKQYIYFLVNKDKPVFKIGVSVNTNQRMRQLGGDFDLEKSFYVECEEAFVVEKILHRVFRKYNVVFTNKEGFTEWFDISCFEDVKSFLFLHKANLAWENMSKIENFNTMNKVYCRLSSDEYKTRIDINNVKREVTNSALEHNNFSRMLFFQCVCKNALKSGVLLGKIDVGVNGGSLVFKKDRAFGSFHKIKMITSCDWTHCITNLLNGELNVGNEYRFIQFRTDVDATILKYPSVQLYLSIIESIPHNTEILNEIEVEYLRLRPIALETLFAVWK